MMTESQRVAMLDRPSGKISIVLDTDAFCEVDDQFAIAYAVRAAQAGELTLEAIHAAPFANGNTHAVGLELSYQEIHHVLDLLHSPEYKDRVFRGADRAMENGEPVPSEATDNLIRLARDPNRAEPLYVAAIGTATNIASALKIAPDIAERIVVIWLGGNALHFPPTREFNLCQDVAAAQYLFDSGVPLVHMPCNNAVSGMCTTIFELEHYLDGKSDIGTYLCQINRDYAKVREDPKKAWSKVIWDVVCPVYPLHPEWFETRLIPTPILLDDQHWAVDPRRPLMRVCDSVYRDSIFKDVFNKLAQ